MIENPSLIMIQTTMLYVKDVTFLYEYDSNGYLVYENTPEENYFHIYEKEGNIITRYMFVEI